MRPWLIGTAEQLATVSEAVYLDNHYILMNDIDLAITCRKTAMAGVTAQVGNPSARRCSFTGTFDGNGHSVENLFINRPGTTTSVCSVIPAAARRSGMWTWWL